MKGLLYAEDPHDGPVFEFPGLRVQAASQQMLLAMKVVAERIGESPRTVRASDIQVMCVLVEISS